MTENELQELTDRISQANQLRNQIADFQSKVSWLEKNIIDEIKIKAQYDDFSINTPALKDFVKQAIIKVYTDRIEECQSAFKEL